MVSGAGHFSFGVASSLNAIGFLPGAAVGASSGFTSGFVSGTGNSLMQGENLKKSLGNGLQSGAWGAGIGGLTGGLAGGIRASKLGNDFWTGNPKNRLNATGRLNMASSERVDKLLTDNKLSEISELYIDSYLVFDGDNLYFGDNYSNETSRLRDSWSSVSGPYGEGALPDGNYIADNLRTRTAAGMIRDGVGFSVDLNPQFETHRTLLRIHPDGGVPGTFGCIGIQQNAAMLNLFFNSLSSYFNRHSTTIRLIVF